MPLDYTSYPLKRSFSVTPDEQYTSSFKRLANSTVEAAQDLKKKVDESSNLALDVPLLLRGISEFVIQVSALTPDVKVNIENDGISKKDFREIYESTAESKIISNASDKYYNSMPGLLSASSLGPGPYRNLNDKMYGFDKFIGKSYENIPFARMFYFVLNEESNVTSLKITYRNKNDDGISDTQFYLKNNEVKLFKDVWNDRLEKSVHSYLAELDSMSTVIPSHEVGRRKYNAKEHMTKLYMS